MFTPHDTVRIVYHRLLFVLTAPYPPTMDGVDLQRSMLDARGHNSDRIGT